MVYQTPTRPALTRRAATYRPLTARALRMPGPQEGRGAARLARPGAGRASLPAPARRGDRGALARDGASSQHVDPTASAAVFEELARPSQAHESFGAGRRRIRAGGARARARRRSGGRDHRPPVQSVIETRPFEFLRRTPAEQIVTFLRNEAPQTVALVVANLHSTLAAQVLVHLSGGEQAEIALRIARMGETSPDVVRQVENVMRQKLASVVQQDSRDGRRRQVARRDPQPGRPHDRAQRARVADRAPTRSSATRSGACCSCSRTSPSSTTARSS